MIVVEGGIAAGKSSVLEHVGSYWKHPIYLEPVAAWEKMLARYYQNENVGFELQTRIAVDMTLDIDTSPLTLHERCAWTMPDTFVEVMLQEGRLTPEDADLLRRLIKRLATRPSDIIYLRCEPGEALRRLQQRKRACENEVSLDYLTKLHRAYESAMAKATWRTNVCTIDVTHRDRAEVNSLVGYYMDKLCEHQDQ